MTLDFQPQPDTPTLNDALGRGDLLKTVVRALAYGEAPQVFGIDGDWGAGKTSFLHCLYHELEGECPLNLQSPVGKKKAPKKVLPHVRTVWFEAWRYQHDETPVVALLREMRSQLSFGRKFFDQAKKLGEVSIRGALASLEDLTAKIGFQASKIQDAGEKYERDKLAATLPSHHVREQLNLAIKQLIRQDNGQPAERVVVMIDDLDRCEAATAFRLLEGIKIYLDLSSCIFVLGINQRAVVRAIAEFLSKKEHSDSSEVQIRAHEYMEKLCSVIWRLPSPAPADRADFAHRILGKSALADGIHAVLQSYDCLPANPRKIKAFCNRIHYLIHARQQQLGEQGVLDPADAALIVILANLYQFHPEIYRILQDKPAFYSEIQRCCQGKATQLHELLKQTQLPWSAVPGDAKAPTPPPPSFQDRYLDPAYGNILRVQRLISDSVSMPVSSLEPYLRI